MSDGTAAPDPGPGPDPSESTRPVPGAQDRVRGTWESMPWFLRWAVVWSACLLVIAAALYLLATVAARLAPLTIALAATLFLAAMLDPLAVRLRRLRLPAALAALVSLFLLLGVIGGAGISGLDPECGPVLEPEPATGRGAGTAPETSSPVPCRSVQSSSTGGPSRPPRGCASRRRTRWPGRVRQPRSPAGVLLIFVLLFFLLKDGRPMWGWVLRRVSDRSRPAFVQAGRNGWHTLSAYTRGTVAIAAIDAIGIGLALVLLGVPLALPLAVITFLGGFVPIIGATVAGSVAVLVALAANGPVTALLALAAVIAVQQLEGNLLEPLIMKRQVRLHPVVILVAVTAGTLFGGIAGAFVAVPITAVVYRVVDTVSVLRQGEQPAT